MWAVPAQKGQWRQILLADGTEVKAELCGDEQMHYWRDANGTCYEKSETAPWFRKINLQQRAQKVQSKRTRARQQRRRAASCVGEKKGLIVLVDFNDKPFADTHTPDLYRNIANAEGFTNEMGFSGSIRDYFKSQSEGALSLHFDVVGPVHLPNPYAHYGENDELGNDRRAGCMVAEACLAADGQVDFSDYDWDGDGQVEQVVVLYAGEAESTSNDDATVWPHEWQLRFSDYGKDLLLDGTGISTYACCSELGTGGRIDGIGTFCHEFSHCLGLPDMYDTSGGDCFGMSDWDVMDSGCYNGHGFVPSAFTGYERMACGWKQPIELQADTVVKGMKALADGGNTYIIYNKNSPNEYYLLENRQCVGWDQAQAGSGLLVLHVDFNTTAWANNEVNVLPLHQRCSIFHADNEDGTKTSQLKGDPYPHLSNNSLARNSVPAATLFHENRHGQKFMDGSIKDIVQHDDGTVSFAFSTSLSGETEETASDTLLHESFDQCNGKGGNDGIWNDIRTRELAFYHPDCPDWTFSYVRGGRQCVLAGKSNRTGIATTPPFHLRGQALMTFLAAPWKGDRASITLQDASGVATIYPPYVELQEGEWTPCFVRIVGSGWTSISIIPGGNRFFLDEVLVKHLKVPTGIDNAGTPESDKTGTAGPPNAKNHASPRIYNICGNDVGTDFSRLEKGIYIVNRQKVVKR
ncbi:MAG: M6 family metalloprotease domain-containing protein [Prevotellaceae bacterium]|nr:M6 family metalloprotease domain-containing protein [Prevotella sp.]MDD7257297.1 M6 family metalloprotease domain-containing protein [Prevotellaceae bacterium]